MSTKYISVDSAAERLSISPQAVRSLLARGLLTGINEPWGPGTRWKVSAASVAARKRAKAAGKLPTRGPDQQPRKSAPKPRQNKLENSAQNSE